MLQILHSSQIAFQTKRDSAQDLDAILKAHGTYLSQIYNRCFLHENNHVLRNCVLKMLNSTLLFQRLWDDGVTSAT